MRNVNSPQSSAARRCGVILILMATGAVLACQHKSPEQELIEQAEPAGSWIATLQMAGEKWGANSVPASFVRSSAKVAHKAFATAAEEAAKSKARPDVRLPLRQLISEAESARSGLERAVEANDRGAAARQVGLLAALHSRFEGLTKAGGGGS